jgi:DNA-directed RNA polymerase specialized sigma24 family protein
MTPEPSFNTIQLQRYIDLLRAGDGQATDTVLRRICGRLERWPAAGCTNSPTPAVGPTPTMCCEQLPAQERGVVSLMFYHGWTQPQIAELFQVDQRTIRRRSADGYRNCKRRPEGRGTPGRPLCR